MKANLKPIIPILVFALILGSVRLAMSGTTEILNLMNLGMAPELAVQIDKQYSSALTSSEIPNVNNAIDLGSLTKSFRNIYVGSSVVYASGAGVVSVPYVPTFAATPVAGTNIVQSGLNIFPTAAANTAVLLPLVPTLGASYRFFNNGPNTVRVKAQGTPGVNGAAAGTYVPVLTFQAGECIGQSATNYACQLYTVPTPAGP